MYNPNAPTIIPPRDPEIESYERLAARHPDESVYTKWLAQRERAAIVDARMRLRDAYARRGNSIAMLEHICGSLPAVVRP